MDARIKFTVDDVLELAFDDAVGAIDGVLEEVGTLFLVGEVGDSVGAVFIAGFVKGGVEGILVCHCIPCW